MTLKRTLITSTLAIALVASAVPAANAWSISDIFSSGHKTAAANTTRVDPLASLTTAEKTSLKTMTQTEREAFLKTKGITLPARGEGRGMMDETKMPAMSDTLKALIEDLRTARESGDTANVTALRTKIQTQREADMKAHEAAMDTAIAGGYETWKAFVEKDSAMPKEMMTKVTADNFATFVEMHIAQKKVRELSDKLGLRPMGGGMGGDMGEMMGGGHGKKGNR